MLQAKDSQVTEKGQIYIASHDTSTNYKLRISKGNPNSPTSYRKECLRQHLYFVSDREIKGNVYMDKYNNLIVLTHEERKQFDSEIRSLWLKKMYFNVEASTDETLGSPLIPQTFLEKYVEKKGDIKDVMLEMVQTVVNTGEGGYDYFTIKIRPDNSVIVHKVKENWTKEEIKQIGLEIMNLGMKVRENQLAGFTQMSGNEFLEQWFEKNL